MKRMLIFWEMRDSSISFTPILPKPSHHTIHKVYLLGTQLTLPNTMGNSTILQVGNAQFVHSLFTEHMSPTI